jgi:hypothetical protein
MILILTGKIAETVRLASNFQVKSRLITRKAAKEPFGGG